MMQIRMSSPTHAHELDEAIATRIHTFDRRVLVRAHEEIPGKKSIGNVIDAQSESRDFTVRLLLRHLKCSSSKTAHRLRSPNDASDAPSLARCPAKPPQAFSGRAFTRVQLCRAVG